MREFFGYRWFCLRIWLRSRPEQVAWWLAWKLPRKVALLAFVRVCSATGESPSEIRYDTSYKAWEQGAGR